MWSAIRWLVLRLAAVRWLFKLGWLGLLVPVALVLKTIGLPLMGVLGIVMIPLLMLLFLFGLPIILVLLFGGLFMGLVGAVLSIGVAVIKVGLFVVLPIWVMVMVCRMVFRWMRRRRGGDDTPPTTGPAASTTPPPPPPAAATADFEVG